ncbi:MAG: hypothetical protein V4608_16400 [Bacteroidota bacterium]
MDNPPLINKISYYFSFLMVALYLVIGLLFLFTDIAIETFPVYREMVGGLLVVYAVYRVYAIIKKRNRQE